MEMFKLFFKTKLFHFTLVSAKSQSKMYFFPKNLRKFQNGKDSPVKYNKRKATQHQADSNGIKCCKNSSEK